MLDAQLDMLKNDREKLGDTKPATRRASVLAGKMQQQLPARVAAASFLPVAIVAGPTARVVCLERRMNRQLTRTLAVALSSLAWLASPARSQDAAATATRLDSRRRRETTRRRSFRLAAGPGPATWGAFVLTGEAE